MNIYFKNIAYGGFDTIISKETFEGADTVSINMVEEEGIHVINMALSFGCTRIKYVFECFDNYEQLLNQLHHMASTYIDCGDDEKMQPGIELTDPVETLEIDGIIRSMHRDAISYLEDENIITFRVN